MSDTKFWDEIFIRECEYILPEMLVYRVENKKGIGPYRMAITAEFLHHHNDSNNHPTPSLYIYGPDLFFGFKSLSQTFNWFDYDDCQMLESNGFFLTTWRVHEDAVFYDDCQITFVRKQAKLIESKPIFQALEAYLLGE